MRRTAIVALALSAQALFATKVWSQALTDLHVRLDAGDGMPVSGALVALVSGDRVVAEGLSSETGRITIASAPGTYRVRVRRIGFRPFVSDPVSLPFKGELALRVETQRIVLEAMVVSASAQCGEIKRDAQTLSVVWDEITKALRASQLTPADLTNIGSAQAYRREIGKKGEILSNTVTVRNVSNQRPFGIPDPPSLSRLGYVRGDPRNGWEYFGPDEAVLLSDDFAATHCFTVVRDSRNHAGQIGVAFEPAPQRMLSDIKGVLWVDAKTSELRDMNFVFVNAGLLTKFKPGGFTKFLRVPSGAWIVKEWQLRMPTLVVKQGYEDTITQVGSIENGGVIVLNDVGKPPLPTP